MMKPVRFYVNNTRNINGASIFGVRLKEELIRQGWRWDSLFPSVSFLFSSGVFRPFCKNILRLDGLYFDSENTLGDSDRLNVPLFKAYKKTEGVIFQSDFSRQLFYHFAGVSPTPHEVIHNGVPSVFLHEGERVDYGFRKTLICSAGWSAVKRLNCIIEGFLEYGNPDVGLVVLGWGVSERVSHPNIRYLDRVFPHEIPRYLRGADAFIHLSWFDSCPNTVVEALACGLPVVCTHNGGTKEIVRTNGIILQCEEDFAFDKVPVFSPPRCDKKKVASAIEKILQWNGPVDAGYLRIENVAEKYMTFARRFFQKKEKM